MLTAERLRELLCYNLETGDFTWLVAKARCLTRNRQAGKAVNSDGYCHIKIDNKSYKSHRLAWLYVHGRWPEDQIDHVNGDRSDNRWSNLRPATFAENAKNRKVYSSNSSGVPGVYWNNRQKKWHATIGGGRRRKHIGFFENLETAIAERKDAEHSVFGDFRRVSQSHSPPL